MAEAKEGERIALKGRLSGQILLLTSGGVRAQDC